MFHLQKYVNMRAIACLLIVSMILANISSSLVVYADEAMEEASSITTWNFRGGEEGAFSGNVEGTTGEFDRMLIDAKEGKLEARPTNGDTQMNTGTKLLVPVSGSAIVMVKTYPGYHNYTVNGEAADADEFQFTYTGEPGYVEITATDAVYLYEISVSTMEEEVSIPESDTEKIDVWDFGAELLDESIYNNKLTKDIINTEIFPGVTPGSSGKNLASFTLNNGEFSFSDGGASTTHRLRTSNKELTHTDEKTLSANGVTYSGYIYSNQANTTNVNLGIHLSKNDILTLVVASNGNKSTINVEAPSKKVATQVHTNGSSTATVMTFYASETGTYKIYSTDEKLVVARVYREHTKPVEITGNVIAPEGLCDYAVTFTNQSTGEVTSAPVIDGMYTTTLNEKYAYDVALQNASGYVISSESLLTIPENVESLDFNVVVEAVSLCALNGKIIGLSPEALSQLKLTFVSEGVFIPEMMISIDGTYNLQLETGMEYDILVEGVNDYSLTGNGKISVTESKEFDFEFVEKAKYPVDVTLAGIDEAAKSNGTITFTNINEEGYSYTFHLTDDNIELRNGQYSIKVAGTGEYPYAMALSPDVKVAGAKTNATVNFTGLTSWNFATLNKDFGGQGIETIGGKKYYYGLQISESFVAENKTYLLMSSGGEINVPVKANDVVTISYCYAGAFKVNDDLTVDEMSGSTGQIDTVSYKAKETGMITISCFTGEKAKQTYVTGITVTTPVEYKSVITVGNTGCDYKTINEALEAVKEMNRADNARVTIEIQPGNYEEMLVVDIPNVTLKNASSAPSIGLTNKGVDIEAQAVRITSYYGHGYSYYSMGTDGKYDANTLAVNKSNDYLSYHNPGAGTTNGSYWNATVVIMADGFQAEGIIFENSFNQYISKKEANDVVVLETGNKGERSTTVGSTAVQDKAYVERAAALAIANNSDQVVFRNCRFVGRQDTLYGGSQVRAAFDKCAIMGGTDYIFGPMTAAFYKCDLVMNTSEGSTDVAYITAPQQSLGRGYLMYNCHITSTVPGVDTASAYYSKPGYLGRPWKSDTSEVVFYNTVIEHTNFTGSEGQSLILPVGWNSTLGGTSPLSYEYGTMERGTFDHKQRASWAKVLETAKLSDDTAISLDAFLNGNDNWSPIVMDSEENTLDNLLGFDIEVPEEPQSEVTPIDLLAGLSVGTTYGGAAGITVLDNMLLKNTPEVIAGVNYEGYVQGTINPDPNKGAVPTKGAVVKVSPTVDGVFSIILKLGANKDFYVVKADGTLVETLKYATESFIEKKYEMKAGDIYYIYGSGTKIPIYSLAYKKSAVKYVLDISQGLLPSTDYNGIEVLEKMAYKLDLQNIEGIDYAGNVAGTGNPTPSKGDIPTAGSVVKVTPKEDGKFTIAFKLNSGKLYYFVDNNKVLIDEYTAGSSNEYITKTYEVLKGKSYYFYGQGTKIPIYGMQIVYGDDSVAWSDVKRPAITNVSTDGGNITVDYQGEVGNGYADSISLYMYEGETLKKIEKVSAPGVNGSVIFTPEGSGKYHFKAILSREGEADKIGETSDVVEFILPLAKPEILYINNLGKGSIKVAWGEVLEATNYKVLISKDGTSYDEVKETTSKKVTITGLTIGATYSIKVMAYRDSESASSVIMTKEIQDTLEISWNYSAFGSGVDTQNNSYDDSIPGTVKLWSKAGKGKLVPASTDGLAFYYTTVDASENFKLSAKVKVNEWTYSNGQEGFGLMAADAVGINGDPSTFWNNSYMASVTKVEYLWDSSIGEVSDVGSKISMYLGVGAQEKTQVTNEKLDLLNAPNSTLTAIPGFSSTMVPLDTSCGILGAGSYNIVKNFTNADHNLQELSTDEFILTIQRDNTGYRISYVDLLGNVQKETYYHEAQDALTNLDGENIYVGFFASRYADITVSDIEFSTSDPATDPPAEPRPITYVTPSYDVTSTTATGMADYELVYVGNADGILTITDAKGNYIAEKEAVSANTPVKKNVTLTKGNNTYTIIFTPDEDYKPGKFKVLSSYETKTFTHTVVYKNYNMNSLYVSPNGTTSGDGSRSNPLDIYTAVKYVTPGQKIVLAGGTYNLKSPLTVERGIDGSADAMIYMIADPKATTRPVFNFNKVVTGIVFAGDYWYIQGFDVTNSADKQKGLQLSGSNCVLDDIHAYNNGNTGIQLSRFKTTDTYEDWPANNLVLNCTSYGNADKGYEDADGFAAKLTIGDGNVFDGCIAYNNADDGWDLFAKP
ncbi:MAG: pectinesterase family protein, partial [Anaerocolumna sp.]